MKSVTIFLPENIYTIASREAGQLGVDRYLEHFVANHFYEETKVPPKKQFEIIENRPTRHSSNGLLPVTVLQIYSLVRSMSEDGLSFRKAVKVAAAEFGVNESTIQDKCTRRITVSDTNEIKTDQFLRLFQTGNLVSHLCQKFPDHRQAIIEKFQTIIPRKANL